MEHIWTVAAAAWQWILGLLAIAGPVVVLWLKAHAAVIVGYLDKYWDPGATNQQLEDEAVKLFREHLLGACTPAFIIRAAVRWVCRHRQAIKARTAGG